MEIRKLKRRRLGLEQIPTAFEPTAFFLVSNQQTLFSSNMPLHFWYLDATLKSLTLTSEQIYRF
jgi:hypothetical protein